MNSGTALESLKENLKKQNERLEHTTEKIHQKSSERLERDILSIWERKAAETERSIEKRLNKALNGIEKPKTMTKPLWILFGTILVLQIALNPVAIKALIPSWIEVFKPKPEEIKKEIAQYKAEIERLKVLVPPEAKLWEQELGGRMEQFILFKGKIYPDKEDKNYHYILID